MRPTPVALIAFLILCTIAIVLTPERDLPVANNPPPSAEFCPASVILISCPNGDGPDYIRALKGIDCNSYYHRALTECPGAVPVLDLFCGVTL